MKKNNNSSFFKDWTTKKLKDEAQSLDEFINGEMPCYGISDIRNLDGVLNELSSRGVNFTRKLSF